MPGRCTVAIPRNYINPRHLRTASWTVISAHHFYAPVCKARCVQQTSVNKADAPIVPLTSAYTGQGIFNASSSDIRNILRKDYASKRWIVLSPARRPPGTLWGRHGQKGPRSTHKWTTTSAICFFVGNSNHSNENVAVSENCLPHARLLQFYYFFILASLKQHNRYRTEDLLTSHRCSMTFG